MNLSYTTEQITFQEVPNEISLSFLIAGCPLKCKGCHSADSWSVTSEAEAETIIKKEFITTTKSKIHPINSNTRNKLTKEYLETRIKQYQNMISCILFLGGEWQIKQLIELLQTVKNSKYANPSLKTCLYTGLELDEIVELIEQEINEVNRQDNIGWKYIFDNNLLDYLKTGRWIRELGGLDHKKTNQRFYKVNVNHKEVGISSQNCSSYGLFDIGINNNCSHNLIQCQLNNLDVKQVLSNILIDNTWMFQ